MSIHVFQEKYHQPKYIFDVDGTLTPSRRKINSEFEDWFKRFAQVEEVYLVTGSDKPKTIEQVGEYLYNTCKRVYQCSGAEVYNKDDVIFKSSWEAPLSLIQELRIKLKENKFGLRTGTHIEHRTGLVNFSIVGRNCTLRERKLYVQYDEENDDRKNIAKDLSVKFPDIEFKVAGETGIDITPLGSNKSQILKDFDPNDHIYFFGDKTEIGGNDYEIFKTVKHLPRGRSYTVEGWKDTWNILKNM